LATVANPNICSLGRPNVPERHGFLLDVWTQQGARDGNSPVLMGGGRGASLRYTGLHQCQDPVRVCWRMGGIMANVSRNRLLRACIALVLAVAAACTGVVVLVQGFLAASWPQVAFGLALFFGAIALVVTAQIMFDYVDSADMYQAAERRRTEVAE
jgi:hypothetical protein